MLVVLKHNITAVAFREIKCIFMSMEQKGWR